MFELPPELRPPVRKLCDAARAKDPAALERSLGGGVVIDGWDDDHDYALGYAAERGYDAIVAPLLRFGADPTTFAKGKRNAWVRAHQCGNPAVVRALKQWGPRPKDGGPDPEALLIAAAAAPDSPEMIDAVIADEPFHASSLGLALTEALAHSRLRSARHLIRMGAALDVKNSDGVVPLSTVSAEGWAELAAELVDAGARMDARDADGNTALHLAARNGHVRTVDKLLALGADPSAENSAGALPVDVARSGMDELIRLLSSASTPRGPTWLDRTGAPIMFVLSRGVGLGFDPRNLDEPILFGGDHDGVHQLSAAWMRAHVTERELEEMGSQWFSTFIDKLIRREDFSLEELIDAARAAGQAPRPR